MQIVKACLSCLLSVEYETFDIRWLVQSYYERVSCTCLFPGLHCLIHIYILDLALTVIESSSGVYSTRFNIKIKQESGVQKAFIKNDNAISPEYRMIKELLKGQIL